MILKYCVEPPLISCADYILLSNVEYCADLAIVEDGK